MSSKVLSKHFCLRLAFCVVGIAIISLSSAILYLLQLGSDPYQLLAVALHKRLGISYGQANNLLNGSIILFMLLFKRRYLKLSLFLCLLISGSFVDIFTLLLSPVITAALPMPVKLLLLLLGCALLSFGVFIYIKPNMGASPADSVGIIISDMIGQPYNRVRIGTDTFFALSGALLGAPIGIATVLSVVLTGPLIGVFQRIFGGSRLLQSLSE